MTSATEFLRLQLSQETHALGLPWADEHARWAEFVFCVLFQARPKDAVATRHAVSMAQDLGLLNPALLKEPSQEERATLKLILLRAGWSTSEIEQTLIVMKRCASVMDRFAWKPQLLLRQVAEALRDSIVAEFGRAGLPQEDMRAAVGHWLQNACSLPISIDYKVLASFAEANNLTVSELIQAADEIDINIAILDDLILRKVSQTSAE